MRRLDCCIALSEQVWFTFLDFARHELCLASFGSIDHPDS